jgi:hypothetical protein
MKHTITLMQSPDGRQDIARIFTGDRSVDILLTGEFVVLDYRPSQKLGPCGVYHEENRYGVCRVCAQREAAETRKMLTSSINVIQSIRGEQNEES